jgi:ABC-2 type transport system permease protein
MMTSPSNAVPVSIDSGSGSNSKAQATAVTSPNRTMYWSIRREFWEYRSLYIAPLAIASLYLFGFLIGLIHLPARTRAAAALSPMQMQMAIARPYDFAALMLMGTTLLVAIFYCLDALHGERRDRSILFWKSLPVSDLTTVLSKAAVPIVALPVLTFVITIATQWIMLLLNTVALLGSGISPALLWNNFPWFQMSLALFLHLLLMHGLFYAPFYGWFLLVSAWARRATFLWAILPVAAIGIFEKLAFNTSYFLSTLLSHFAGGPEVVPFPTPGEMPVHSMSFLTLGKFLISPSLWLGLALTAAFLAGAVRLRRNQGPI